MPRTARSSGTPRLAYHASRTPLDVGTILAPRAENLLDADIEIALDHVRPHGMIGRRTAVYATPTLSALEHVTAGHDYHYRVEISDFVLLDHSWANRVWRIFAESHEPPTADAHRRIAILAAQYWTGRRAVADPLTPYAPEFLCRSARILEALDD
jgi:hypothetical protein